MGYFGRRPSPAPLSFDDVSDGGSIVIDNAGTIGSVSDTDALSVSSGGVLNFTQEPTVTGEDIYYQGNILGTVSQSGGTPTGAIIEEDSNANGSYVKFADGTMICWRNNFSVNYANTARLTTSFTYAATFVDTGMVGLVSFNDATSVEVLGLTNAGGALVHRSLTTSTGEIRLYIDDVNFSSGKTVTVDFLAIGRWF